MKKLGITGNSIVAPLVTDSSLSDSSKNAVQNKVIKGALDGKVDKVSGKGLSTEDYTAEEKAKLGALPANADLNALLAGKVAVAQGVENVGKALIVGSDGNLATEDITIDAIPAGGQVGDLLTRISTDDAGWVTPASSAEMDNTRPITSAAVYTEIGNINALLATI